MACHLTAVVQFRRQKDGPEPLAWQLLRMDQLIHQDGYKLPSWLCSGMTSTTLLTEEGTLIHTALQQATGCSSVVSCNV